MYLWSINRKKVYIRWIGGPIGIWGGPLAEWHGIGYRDENDGWTIVEAGWLYEYIMGCCCGYVFDSEGCGWSFCTRAKPKTRMIWNFKKVLSLY